MREEGVALKDEADAAPLYGDLGAVLAFDRHRAKQRRARYADETQDADRFAPLFGANHHQCQQKRRAADHRHDRDGDVEALEHGERIVLSGP